MFPNIGLLIAMIDIGTAIGSQALLWVASVATVIQVMVWLLVFGCACTSFTKEADSAGLEWTRIMILEVHRSFLSH